MTVLTGQQWRPRWVLTEVEGGVEVLEAGSPGLKSWLYHVLGVWSWKVAEPLSFRFLSYKIGLKKFLQPSEGCCEDYMGSQMLARFVTLKCLALTGAAANATLAESKLESDGGCLLRPGALSQALNLTSNWRKFCSSM